MWVPLWERIARTVPGHRARPSPGAVGSWRPVGRHTTTLLVNATLSWAAPGAGEESRLWLHVDAEPAALNQDERLLFQDENLKVRDTRIISALTVWPLALPQPAPAHPWP